MLIHRQKVLLALLQTLGGTAGATDFQKHLFLYTRLLEQSKSYDFVPYRFGCYSFQAVADKDRLTSNGYLKDATNWELASSKLNFLSGLSLCETKKLELYSQRSGLLSGSDLICHIYKNYPYFAINSEIAKQTLSPALYLKVIEAKPKRRRKSIFFTIGYEGQNIESYLNTLIQNDIRLLVDVRKNPISRKYGFSKKALSSLTSKFNIKYIHMRQLGIESDQRQNLESQGDYDRLFDNYEKTVLKCDVESLKTLKGLFDVSKRIAITCFEREHTQCHRHRVAAAVARISAKDFITVHL